MIIVDRIENGFAVCEYDSVFIDIPLNEISSKIKPGDVLKKVDNIYIKDAIETEKRRKIIINKQNSLFK